PPFAGAASSPSPNSSGPLLRVPRLLGARHGASLQVGGHPPAALADEGHTTGRLVVAVGSSVNRWGTAGGAHQRLVVAVGRDQYQRLGCSEFLDPATSHLGRLSGGEVVSNVRSFLERRKHVQAPRRGAPRRPRLPSRSPEGPYRY